jgi:hypothetical protein
MPILSGPIHTDNLTLFTHHDPTPPTNGRQAWGKDAETLQAGDICLCRGGGVFVAENVDDLNNILWRMPTAVLSPTPAATTTPKPKRTQTVKNSDA